MRAKTLILWPVFLSLLIIGCDIAVEEHSRAWEPTQEEFIQTVAGNSYSTSWTDGCPGHPPGFRFSWRGHQEITDQERGVNPLLLPPRDCPTLWPSTEMSSVRAFSSEPNPPLCLANPWWKFPLLRGEGEVLLVPIGDGHYRLENLRFGMGNDGNPTLLEANFVEDGQSESGASNMHSVLFVN